MHHSRKRLIQGLLLCSPLALLPLQAAARADSVADNLPVVTGTSMSSGRVKNSLVIPATGCYKRGLHALSGECPPPVPQPAGTVVAQLASQWLNQYGRAEIVLADRLSDPTLGSGSLALLLPLCQQSEQLLLTQWGVRRDHQQTTLNVGLGQRWFNQAQGYWGYNVFYDYRRQGHHGRLGLGLEQRSAARSVAVNGYLPFSPWRIAEDQATQSRQAKGIDLRLQQQLPQRPQLQLNVVLEHYFAHALVAENAQQSPPRPTALTVGLDYTPVPLVTASYGYQLASAGVRHHQLQLNLTYRLGVPLALQLDPKQVAQAQTLASSRYALIRRNSQFVLEQRAYAPPAKADKADNAQAPEDTLQIELPNERQTGKPGESLTVSIKLSSSCALKDWHFTGEGDFTTQGGALQVDAEQQQATLTLPEQPGDYSLEIVASKAQGVTTRSNTLQVRVQAAEVEKVPPQPEAQGNKPTIAPQPSIARGATAHQPVPTTKVSPIVGSKPTAAPVIDAGNAQQAPTHTHKTNSSHEQSDEPTVNQENQPPSSGRRRSVDTDDGGDTLGELRRGVPPSFKGQRRASTLSDTASGTSENNHGRFAILSELETLADFKNKLFNNSTQSIGIDLAEKFVRAVEKNEGPLETEEEFKSVIGNPKHAEKIIKFSGLEFKE